MRWLALLLPRRVWQVIFQQIVAISDDTGCRTGRLDADSRAAATTRRAVQTNLFEGGLPHFDVQPAIRSDLMCLLVSDEGLPTRLASERPLPDGRDGWDPLHFPSRTPIMGMDRGGCEGAPRCQGPQPATAGVLACPCAYRRQRPTAVSQYAQGPSFTYK